MTELVSIIVPVYNGESYLVDCVQSIRSQTYNKIEIILINDGSTDRSGIICDEFSKEDLRIKVIHQPNSGPSISRNKGIELAQGKYIQFVDADDTIESTLTEKLIVSMNNDIQLVVSGYKIEELNMDNTLTRQNVIPKANGVMSIEEFLGGFGLFSEQNLINPLWNKLYLSDLIKKGNIKFVQGLNMGEDLLFNLEYFKVCCNINLILETLYNYKVFNNINSLTGNYKSNLFENQQMLFGEVRRFLKDNSSYKDENINFIGISFVNSLLDCFSNLFHKNSCLSARKIKEQIDLILDTQEVRDHVKYFNLGNVQQKVIGFFVRTKSVNGIYYFFKVKNILREKLNPIFNVLKKIIINT